VKGTAHHAEFLAALEPLARKSAIMLAADQAAPDDAPRQVGSRGADRAGRRLGGCCHADLPIAVDRVSGRSFDG
jgi:hypothetical protein